MCCAPLYCRFSFVHFVRRSLLCRKFVFIRSPRTNRTDRYLVHNKVTQYVYPIMDISFVCHSLASPHLSRDSLILNCTNMSRSVCDYAGAHAALCGAQNLKIGKVFSNLTGMRFGPASSAPPLPPPPICAHTAKPFCHIVLIGWNSSNSLPLLFR